MSILWADNFSYTGGSITELLQGLWAQRGSAFGVGEAGTYLEVPSWESTGKYWLALDSRGSALRRVLNASLTSVGHCFNFRVPALPDLNNRLYPIEWRDGTNTMVLQMRLTTDGNLTIHNAAGTQIATTAAPCIVAGTVHKVQVQAILNAGAGECEVRVDNAAVITATGLSNAGTATQIVHWINDTSSGPHGFMWVGFSVPYSLTGTYNNDWPAISGVASLYPNADTSEDHFTPRPRQLFGAANLRVIGSGAVLDCDNNTDYNLGTADYTLEGWWRFTELPTTTNFATLMGKWSASTSNRSYRLVKYGPDVNDGNLRFEITTDGTLGTLTPVIDVAWEPSIGHWYYIAICRDAGVTRLFVDGEILGTAVADANNYFAATANFTLGGEMSGTGTTVLANSSINGSIDEVRMTPGVARYDANFAPPTGPFPTTIGGDPSFASVVLLCSFDEDISDLSNAAQTLEARGACSRQEWADAGALYLTVNDPNPVDDRFLEAAYLAAIGVLTVDDQPTAGETVTLGATTYEFVAALVGANDVLIGATVADSVENLIDAINQGPGEGVTYGTGTAQNASALATPGPAVNQITATAITPGAAGNSIASTETGADLEWTGATLAGGQDIPSPTEFTITPLPAQATGLRALFLLDRSYVDVDNASLQKSFVVDGNAALGDDNALTTTPTYRGDVIEEDPDTSAALTPQSVLVGRIRLDRTS